MDRWKRMKEWALIVVAGGMLTFEAVGFWGALPIVRRALHPVADRRVRIITVERDRPYTGTTVCRSLRLTPGIRESVAAALGQALL